MKLGEFEKLKCEYIEKCKRKVKGDLNRQDDIKKADFNGVYVVLNENDEVVLQVVHIQIDLP